MRQVRSECQSYKALLRMVMETLGEQNPDREALENSVWDMPVEVSEPLLRETFEALCPSSSATHS